MFAALIESGKSISSQAPAEGSGLRKNGELFEVEISFNLSWYENKPFFTIIARDISQRKQLEKSLYEREQRFRLLFENAPIGICFFDKNGLLLQANKYCEQCFGHSRDQLLRHGLSRFLHPDDREHNKQAFLGILKNQNKAAKHFIIENRYFAADGRVIYTKQSVQGLFDANGNISFVIVLTEDITVTKQLSLANAAIIEKLKDVHLQLNNFASLLAEDKYFEQAASLSDYNLTAQESRIASMIYHGSTNKSIAQKLCVSENTVKHHITSLYNKIKVKNRVSLITMIRQNNITL